MIPPKFCFHYSFVPVFLSNYFRPTRLSNILQKEGEGKREEMTKLWRKSDDDSKIRSRPKNRNRGWMWNNRRINQGIRSWSTINGIEKIIKHLRYLFDVEQCGYLDERTAWRRPPTCKQPFTQWKLGMNELYDWSLFSFYFYSRWWFHFDFTGQDPVFMSKPASPV